MIGHIYKWPDPEDILKRNDYTKRLSPERLEMIAWNCIKESLWPGGSFAQRSRFRTTGTEVRFEDNAEYVGVRPRDLS